MIVASMVLTTAMIMVFPNASSKEVLSHSFTYQSRVKPFQLIYGFGNGRIVIRGPQVKYLYFGKVMAGRKPKHVTNKDIRYTTTFNRLAGPFWLERLMAAEKDRIIEDERRNILGGP